MYMLRRVCPNQLSEAVCQRCSYEKVVCKGRAKKNYRRAPIPHCCMQLQNLS